MVPEPKYPKALGPKIRNAKQPKLCATKASNGPKNPDKNKVQYEKGKG